MYAIDSNVRETRVSILIRFNEQAVDCRVTVGVNYY